MAVAAATAVIAPVALLAAPAAYATDGTTPPPSPSVSESTPETTPPPSPSVSESTPETTPPPSPSVSESTPETTPPPSPSASESSPAPTASESETPDPESSACEDSKVDVSISGLPGKIAAGSGWHKFSLNVQNNSDSTLNDLDFFAGASADKNGEELFSSKKVQLQAWDPEDKIWVDLNAGGYAVGYVGYTDELKPDYEVNIPLRLNVKPSAPVGAGFSLGATIYGDNDAECTGFGQISYKFQIVSAGTDTGGTKPQEGGKAPVTDEKPSGNTPEVTGSLAETGSSSALPMISLVGGAAVVAGAGAIFVVRRRKTGAQA
ncbi:LAETG motif-containing sortase-dependent surface protein [Streptomyces sp. DG1A-41]|uniref:LAETG motif-containing sortase-dependent surface protein n=1 Tax=Streptomyces sp. DG1A-41 TaxID=3125779 RepID=UPI0030CF7894